MNIKKNINISEKSLNISCWYNKQLKKIKKERIIEFYYIDFLQFWNVPSACRK